MEGRYGMQGFYCSDMNGDGLDDLVVSFVEWEGLNEKYFFDKVKVWFSECTSQSAVFDEQDLGRPDAATQWEDAFSYLFPKLNPRQYLLIGDFTGDGRSDLLAVLYNRYWNGAYGVVLPADMRTYLWTETDGWVEQVLSSQVAASITYCKAIDALNFDADGKLDLLLRKAEGSNACLVSTTLSDGSWEAISQTDSPEWYPDPNEDMDEFEIAIGDLNGDGFHDVLHRQEENH